MNTRKNKLLNWNFTRIAKRFILIALCVMLTGGIVSGFLLRTQIREAIELSQSGTYPNEAYQNGSDELQLYGHSSGRGQYHREENFYAKEIWKSNARIHHSKGYYGWGAIWKSGQISRPSAAALIAAGVTRLACKLLFAAYWLLVAAWLYQAAHRSSMNPLLWTLAGLAGNLIAVVVFLLVRSFTHTQCGNCGTWQQEGSHCRKCGNPMGQTCPSCNAAIHNGDIFCGNCGKSLLGDA